MLAVADVIGLTISFVVSMLAFAGSGTFDTVSDAYEFLVFALSLPGWLVVAKLYGLYDSDEERTDHSTADDLVGVFHLVTVGSWIFFIASTLTGLAHPQMARLITFWLLAIALVTSLRALARALCRRSAAYTQNTLIVGAGDIGQLVARKISQHPEYGLNVVGFVDSFPKQRHDGLGKLAILGPPERLSEIVTSFEVERVLVAFSNDSHEDTLDLIRCVNRLDVQIDIVPRLFEVLGTNVGIHTIEGVPLMGLPPTRLSRSSLLLKRVLDLAIAGTAMLFLLPLFAAVAVAIKLDTRGPVFFTQLRMGHGDRVFRIYKFRTMLVDAEERKAEIAHLNKHLEHDPRMFKITNDPRITRAGIFLRRYSIDELPQFLNVLRGEMSIVGPRPLILEEDQYVVDWRRRRLNLKPGITGLWQVLGRDVIPFDEMVKLDYLYVTTWSMLNDLKLMLRTIPVVLRANAC